MSLWRDFLRLFGLSGEARVKVAAPGVEVVITGDPEQVRALLSVVKHELERGTRRRRQKRHRRSTDTSRRSTSGAPPPSAQMVLPTELDETDSPYALPDALVRPVAEPAPELIETTEEDARRVRVSPDPDVDEITGSTQSD